MRIKTKMRGIAKPLRNLRMAPSPNTPRAKPLTYACPFFLLQTNMLSRPCRRTRHLKLRAAAAIPGLYARGTISPSGEAGGLRLLCLVFPSETP
jgi:hypothetical protein